MECPTLTNGKRRSAIPCSGVATEAIAETCARDPVEGLGPRRRQGIYTLRLEHRKPCRATVWMRPRAVMVREHINFRLQTRQTVGK